MINIRQANIADSSEIASLIMEAMNPECCRWFYGPLHTDIDFHSFLSELVEAPNTQYSYLNTLIAEDDDTKEIAGMLVSYDGAKLHRLRKPFIEGVKKEFERDFSDINDETQAGELYLDSLCVKEMYRHQGIATRLLKASIEKARQLSLENVGLLVDKNNPNAEHLYASLGFKVIDENSWGGHSMKHMVYNIG